MKTDDVVVVLEIQHKKSLLGGLSVRDPRETELIGDTYKEIYDKAMAHVIMEAESPMICLSVYRLETGGG